MALMYTRKSSLESMLFFFFSSRRRHTRLQGDWSSDVCSSDLLAGIARDEIDDPRPYCEIIRQWATLHPEFTYLPRKFKIAVTGSPEDRAASEVHDIGLQLARDARGDIGFTVLVGGGLGRSPMIGQVIREFLPLPDLLSYLEAILRVYNRHGRRDNLNKARIKVLVKSLGVERFREQVEEEIGRAHV